MKRKTFAYKVADLDDKGIVTIAISRFDVVDAVGDIVRKGAFTKTFREGGHRIKHVLDHQLRASAIVGLPIKMEETKEYAIVQSKINLDKQIGKDLFSDYKFFAEAGRSLEHSFAYQTIKTKPNKDIKGEDIQELKMFEYSTVALGANEHTPLLDIKSLSTHLLEAYLRKFDVSDGKGKQIEKEIKRRKIDVRALVDKFL